jgi:hypothetical protein
MVGLRVTDEEYAALERIVANESRKKAHIAHTVLRNYLIERGELSPTGDSGPERDSPAARFVARSPVPRPAHAVDTDDGFWTDAPKDPADIVSGERGEWRFIPH